MASAMNRVQTVRTSVISDKNLSFELWELLDNITEEYDFRKTIGIFIQKLNKAYMTEESNTMLNCIRQVCSSEITLEDASEQIKQLYESLNEAAAMFAN